MSEAINTINDGLVEYNSDFELVRFFSWILILISAFVVCWDVYILITGA